MRLIWFVQYWTKCVRESLMAQKRMPGPTDAPELKTRDHPAHGHALSMRWISFVGSLILGWIYLAPLIWIGFLLMKQSLVAQAATLVVVGLGAYAWNQFHVARMVTTLHQEKSSAGPAVMSVRARVIYVLGQVAAAFTCTHLAGTFNPIGMQQWFWMPIAGFAGIILTRRRDMILVIGLTLMVSTVHQYLVIGPETALYWMFGQFTTSVFIMSCSYAIAQACRQRLQTALLADELRMANARLELQADQASVLAAAQERNRLAREIHDTVGHSLTVVGAQLDAAQELLKQSPKMALDSIQKAKRANQEGLAEIRRSVSTMRVMSSGQKSLTESLTALITGVERPGLKLSLQQTGLSRPLPSLVEISLYRCAQEGITNACRHSGASEICVHLDFTQEGSVSLYVTDNGKGFSNSSRPNNGLDGLRERAVLLRGDFFAGTGPDGGGLCRMVIPA